jgi:NADH:ubiquinone oxidoreductase subunit F (NADH-binding)
MIDVLEKIKQAKLVGRGGACYPVWQKWQAVFDAPVNATANGKEGKYVICNCSEGEPGVKKDAYLIERYPERIIDGMKSAIDNLSAKEGIFYLNEEYHKKYKKSLELEIQKSGAPIVLFKKPHSAGYIGGEETTCLNVIEGKHAEPRLRPPYPVTHGLWGQPTLVNNVETFYDVSRVIRGDFQPTRCYTILGDCLFEDVYELPIDYTIEKILEVTSNFPKFDFFVQVGGDGSGEVLNHKQLKKPASGAGTIHVYSTIKYSPINMIRNWVNFFMAESCGKCVPCREGTYRLSELLEEARPDWAAVKGILANMTESSFCALGMSVPTPIIGYIGNVLKDDKENSLKILPSEKAEIIKLLS